MWRKDSVRKGVGLRRSDCSIQLVLLLHSRLSLSYTAPFSDPFTMAPTNSFIIFGGISQEGRTLWVSPSVYDILGFEPEELIGRPGYELISPDDHADLKEFRKEYFINDLIASQMVVRFKRKDGPPLSGVGIVSFCYDFTVAVITALDSGADTCRSGLPK
jgi:PAS domain-containing protein